jgi:hypothetical protein
MNPATPRRALRAALPLVALAAVAILAAPAYADPPTSGAGGDSGTGGKAVVAVANPPPEKPPVPGITSRTVAGMRSLSDRDPWPDPPDIVIGPSPTGGVGPRATTEGPPPIVIED